MQQVLDQDAQWVRAAKRDRRGRVDVHEKATGKVIQRLPVDALEGLRMGLFVRPDAVESKPTTTQSEAKRT